MYKYKAVIFDLDGTLLDTSTDLASAVNYALNKNGYQTYTVKEIISFVGNGVKNLIKRALKNCEDDKIVGCVLGDFKDYYEKNNAVYTAPYEKITDLLKNLKTDGVITAVYSNKYDSAVKKLANKYFPNLINSAFGERDGYNKKPDATQLLEFMVSNGLDKKDCVYIGDSEVDILTAKNAGVNCISVCWGFKGKEFLVKNGAKLLAETVEELDELLK